MVKGILINRKTDESFKSQLKMEHADLVAEMQAVENLPTHERLQLARLRRAQQLKVARQKEKEWLKLQRAKGVNLTTLNGMSTTHHHFRNGATSTGKQHISFENSVVLLEAASRNDMHEVAELLERGITPDAANEDGLTALHQCCIDNNVEMLKLLLDYGASVDAQDSDKWTPLHAAATCGHLELVRILIDHGANLLAVNTDGNMPYDLCDDESTLDYIEAEMSKRGVTQELIDDTRSATERQMLQDLIDLSRNGGDLEQPDEHGATPLHVAAANGYMKVVEFLLEMHVNVDALDRDMWSPVHAAACWGHLEVLEILAQFGADLNIKNKDDETPSDICEDPEIRERIEQLKTEQESKRLAEAQRRRVRRSQSNNTRAQSVRRTSLRDKTLTTKKDAVEEARLRLQAQEVFIVAPDSTTMDPNGADIDYNDATADISPSSSSNWLTKTISSTTSSSHNNHNNNNTLKTNHNHQHRSFYDAASLNHHNNSDAVDSSRTFSLQQNQQQQQQQQKQQHSYQPRRPPEGRENDELQMKAFKGNNEMQQQQKQQQQQQHSTGTSSSAAAVMMADSNLMTTASTTTTGSLASQSANAVQIQSSKEAANGKINVQVTVLVGAAVGTNNANNPNSKGSSSTASAANSSTQQHINTLNKRHITNSNNNNLMHMDSGTNGSVTIHHHQQQSPTLMDYNGLVTSDHCFGGGSGVTGNSANLAGATAAGNLGINKFSGITGDVVSDSTSSKKCCMVM